MFYAVVSLIKKKKNSSTLSLVKIIPRNRPNAWHEVRVRVARMRRARAGGGPRIGAAAGRARQHQAWSAGDYNKND